MDGEFILDRPCPNVAWRKKAAMKATEVLRDCYDISVTRETIQALTEELMEQIKVGVIDE